MASELFIYKSQKNIYDPIQDKKAIKNSSNVSIHAIKLNVSRFSKLIRFIKWYCLTKDLKKILIAVLLIEIRNEYLVDLLNKFKYQDFSINQFEMKIIE